MAIGIAAAALVTGVAGIAGAQSDDVASISAVVAGDGAVTVAWDAPSGIAGGDTVSYDLRYIDADDASAMWTVESDVWAEGPLHYVLSGLANGTAYRVQIRAVVNSADGDWSDSETATPAEPGDSALSAITANLALPVGGEIATSTDVDVFRFAVGSSTILLIHSTGSTDLDATLTDLSGTPIETAEGAEHLSGTNNFVLGWPLSAGTYLLEVEGRDGDTGPYAVHFRPRTDGTGRSNAIPVALDSVTYGVAGPTRSELTHYRLDLGAPAEVLIRTAGSAEDTLGYLSDSTGVTIANNDDGYLHPAKAFALRTRLEAGTYYVSVAGFSYDDFAERGAYRLHVEEIVEPGSTVGTALDLDFNGAAGATIESSTDVDYYKVVVPYRTLVGMRAVSENLDLSAVVLDDSFTPLADIESTTAFRRKDQLFTVENLKEIDAGTYYLRVDTSGWTAGSDRDNVGRYAVAAFEHPTFATLRPQCVQAPAGVEDPLFGCQWNLDNSEHFGGTQDDHINVVPAWETTMGSGVSVAVVDYAVDGRHQDLSDNYDQSNSHDYMYTTGFFVPHLAHGTEVAGIVAAAANDRGLRGVAPAASLRSYNYLNYPDLRNEVDAMARNASTTWVSNNSWGGHDFGFPERVPRVWELAVEFALEHGANGTGTFFVFAAGNGRGDYGDHSNLSEYTSFWGVTAVCAVNHRGVQTSYSESGSNLWVCAPSSDGSAVPAIATTSGNRSYSARFGGTSAAAPQVSGVAALVRSVNPLLTWRDVKLILAGSARQNDAGHTGWLTGAAKYEDSSAAYRFNHAYGFGVVDANAAVELAQSWVNVPDLRTVTAESSGPARTIADRATLEVELDVPGGVQFTEFVEVNLAMDAPKFRSFDIELVSPAGTVSELTFAEPAHFASTELRASDGVYRMGSARHLGEGAAGTWTLRLIDQESGGAAASLASWSLTAYGHATTPAPPTITKIDGVTDPVTVTWTAPQDPGLSAVSSYDLRYVASSSTDAWTEVISAASAGDDSYTVSGLSSGVDYDFEVRAVNAQGAGDWSRAVRGSVGSSTHRPAFATGETGVRAIAENLPKASPVGAPFTASDGDGHDLTYALRFKRVPAFTIDDTGQLHTAALLDHENQATYRFTVVVVDEDGLTSELEVTVDITDVNEAPRYTGDTSPLHSENDHDDVALYAFVEPDGDDLTWTLGGDDAGHLTVVEDGLDPFDTSVFGPHVALRFRNPPDFENPADADGDNVYQVSLAMTDGEFSVSKNIAVRVINVDEPPAVSGSGTTDPNPVWSENDTSEIARFTAVDPESGPIRFGLGGTDKDLFTVVGGTLRFLAPPDFEAPADIASSDGIYNSVAGDNVYDIEVQVRDDENVSIVPMTVTVINVDEPASVTLTSRQPVADNAVTASLTDPDGVVSGPSWSWHRSTDQNAWSVISGATSSSYSPVASDVGNYVRATATFTDGHGAGKIARGVSADKVRATTPANSFAQFGDSETGVRTVAENLAAGASIGAPVTAQDSDGDSLTYSLSGSDASSFSIVPSSGQLRTTAVHDYEDRRRYSVVVSVSDGKDADGNADTAIDDTVTVTVVIADADEAPTLSVSPISGISTLSGSSTIVRPEEIETRSGFARRERRVARFTPVDPENRPLRWLLSGVDAGDFSVNPGGVLSFRQIPNFERKDDANRDGTHQVRVSITDEVNTTHLDVAVRVTNVNEAPQLFARNAGVSENSTRVTDFNAYDPDRESLRWSITGTDAALFQIDDSGELEFLQPPDFEMPGDQDGDNRYQLTVKVRDNRLSSDMEHITVTVRDVDEPPVISGDQSPRLDEGETGFVASYDAEDPEGITIAWELRGADAGRFAITAGGDLNIASTPDFELPDDADSDGVYEVRLVASDGNLTARLPVSVEVVNVDEAGRLRLSSLQPQATFQLTATLDDPDQGIANQTWAWARSTDQSNWSPISSATAAAYTPDGGDVNFWLRATVSYDDDHGTGKSASQVTAAKVRAAPQTNQAPSFAAATATRSVTENQAPGSFGAPVAAVDLDNDTLTYSLVGADASVFDIDSSTGQLSTLVRLDREARASYSFSVRVEDPSRESDVVAVTVTVADVAEPPVLLGPAASNVSEGLLRDAGEYSARDPEGSSVIWSLRGSDAAAFEIVGGKLRFREVPDHEAPVDANSDNLYLVIVVASDGALETERLVMVTVVPVDEPPVIVGSFVHDHPENTAIVGVYSASDPEGHDVELTLEGDTDGHLALTADGTLVFTQIPDFEQPTDAVPVNQLEVELNASDGTTTIVRQVQIRIIDADDPGAVTVSTDEPAVGTQIGASLDDPDGSVSRVQWQWSHSPDRTSWTDIDGATVSRYTPSNSDVGLFLRATATYDDVHRSRQSASAFAVEPVSKPVEVTIREVVIVETRGGGGRGGGASREAGTAVLIVANGWSPPDIGIAATLSARTDDSAVLYTATDRLSTATHDVLTDYLPAEVIVVGGTAAVSDAAVLTARRSSEVDAVRRIAGATRVDTAAAVARRILSDTASSGATVIVVNGWSPPDIGVAAALSARMQRSVVVFASAGELPEPTASVLRDHRPARVLIVGGEAAVAPAVVDAVASAAPAATVERVSGATRLTTATEVARRLLGPPESAVRADLTIMVANGWSPPDIGVAAALSARSAGSVVVYTRPDAASAELTELIADYQPARIVIVGGAAAVGPAVKSALADAAPDASVPRYSGISRTHTAAFVARRILGSP